MLDERHNFLLCFITYNFTTSLLFIKVFIREVQKYVLTSVIDISTDREGQRVYRGEGVIYTNREVQTLCYNKYVDNIFIWILFTTLILPADS